MKLQRCCASASKAASACWGRIIHTPSIARDGWTASAYNNKRRVSREFQRCCCAAVLRFTAAKRRQRVARAAAPTAVRRVHPPFLCSHGYSRLHVAGIIVHRVGLCMQSAVHMVMPLQNDMMMSCALHCSCMPPCKKHDATTDNGGRFIHIMNDVQDSHRVL